MKNLITNSVLRLTAFALACLHWGASAQGIHLSAGESVAFGFTSVSSPQFTEGAGFIGGWGGVNFGPDTLDPGESLRLELFENNLGQAPLVTGIASPVVAKKQFWLDSPGAWLDYQGVERITMLTGTVDIQSPIFVVFPAVERVCGVSGVYMIVPEPSPVRIGLLGGATMAAVWVYRNRRKEKIDNAR